VAAEFIDTISNKYNDWQSGRIEEYLLIVVMMIVMVMIVRVVMIDHDSDDKYNSNEDNGSDD